jgi:hypothetical protein
MLSFLWWTPTILTEWRRQLKSCTSYFGNTLQLNQVFIIVCSEEELRNAKLLVFANKQDMPNAMSMSQILAKLELAHLKREWHLQSCIAVSGKTLYCSLKLNVTRCRTA